MKLRILKGLAVALLAAQAMTNLSAQPATLVALWDFENSDGTVIRSHDGKWEGEIVGDAMLTAPGEGRPNGGGRGFDVSEENAGHLVLAADGDDNPLNLAVVDDQVSVMFWQKNFSNINSSTFWSLSEDSDRHMQFHVPWSNGTIYFDSMGCCASPTQRLQQAPDDAHVWEDEWHHYTFVKDGSTKRIYIDGQLLTEQEGADPLSTTVTEIHIGAQNNGDQPDGVIDDFAIFKGVLSTEEIQAFASGEPAGEPPADTDGDGLPDWWEEFYGFDINDPSDAEADPDGDGDSNLAEFGNGTDPNDTTAPTLLAETADCDLVTVTLEFSEALDLVAASDPSNYTFDPALNVESVEIRRSTVTLTTAAQEPGSVYTLTFSNIVDESKNALAASTSAEIKSCIEITEGALRFEAWFDIPGAAIDGLFDPRVPEPGKNNGDAPDFVGAVFSLNSQDAFVSGPNNNYAARMYGFITPPETGDYWFFVRSDDASELFISTDDDPANAQWQAEELDCCDAFQEPGIDDTTSFAPISMVAGQRYYIEARYKEGGGGDWMEVGWRLDGDSTPAADLTPIDGRFLSTDIPVLAPFSEVNILQQPGSVSIDEGRGTTLTVVAEGTSIQGDVVDFQWQRADAGSGDFSDIAGANEASLDTPVLETGDSGVQYRVIVSVPAVDPVVSDVAVVTVTPDTTEPGVITVAATSLNSVLVSFDEPINEGSLSGATFTFDGGVTASNASLSGTSDVLLQTSTMNIDDVLTLTLSGVADLYGNSVSSSISTFTVCVVTYTDVILQDEPIAFYRFEETSGTTTANFGTLGDEAEGLWMTGAGPEDSEAADIDSLGASGEGPAPGDGFAGFATDNRSAAFNGDLDSLWVDTQGQLLNGLGAFTLEYWVKPRNRLADGWNRIGIVGQNDAIEYGFINTDTIQIWTPGGGALNTNYSFDDDEWHHVATIATGNDIRNYFDGELVGTAGSPTSNYGTSAFNVHIGGGGVYDATGNHFDGFLDEVAIFDKAIPAERVREHYLAGLRGGTCAMDMPPTDGGGDGGTTPPDGGNGGGGVTPPVPPLPPVAGELGPGSSISINFGADEPDGAGSAVTGEAGILGSSVWNNVEGNAGEATQLIALAGGAAGLTDISVSWESNNTWSSTGRGEENNSAPEGEDRNMMTGYLDTNNTSLTTVTVSGLPVGSNYNVIVYAKGGVNGRGGTFTIGDETQEKTDEEAFDGELTAGRDYLIFSNLSGDSFEIVGTPTVGGTPRAPINGIEIAFTSAPPPVPGGGGAPGEIESISRGADGSVTIEFTGSLQAADAVTGPFSDVAGASSPFTVDLGSEAKFYIAR